MSYQRPCATVGPPDYGHGRFDPDVPSPMGKAYRFNEDREKLKAPWCRTIQKTSEFIFLACRAPDVPSSAGKETLGKPRNC